VDQPKIKFIFDGTELEGWELRAPWDDFKSGLKHGSESEKIAMKLYDGLNKRANHS